MTSPSLPASLSLYRGQSRQGLGEGPGNPIAHGEQYLAAAPELWKDAALIAAVRPWFTLDADPADQQKLGDRLEGWSCFSARGFLFVVRLSSAGIYDRRAAYFAHGRAWRLDSLPPEWDPGLLVGRADAFDAPRRDLPPEGPPTSGPEPVPALQRGPLEAQPDLAARLLAHLLMARIGGYPLIVALPPPELATGSPWYALLAFCRAALPADLRQTTRVRLYSRLPEIFLRTLGANLVAVPQEVAPAALAACPEAVLLDRAGEVRSGEAASPRALAYAKAVVERALDLPDGLPLFAERYARHRLSAGLPEEADLRSVQITYNLAYAFGAVAERGDDLVRSYLPFAARTFGPGLSWPRLIPDAEWGRLPGPALRELLLRGGATPGERELGTALAGALGRVGNTLDGDLEAWWETAGADRLERLLSLLACQPPLVSPARAAALTARLGIAEVAAAGSPAGLLAVELQAGSIGRREGESAALAALARSPEVFALLARATSEGLLSPEWARVAMRAATGEERVAAALRLLPAPDFWERWDNVPKVLLDGLRELDPVPPPLLPVLLQAAARVDPIERLELYVRLVDLMAALSPGERNPLRDRLFAELPRLSDLNLRRYLVRIALDGAWRCLDARALVRPNGELALPWEEGVADLLLGTPEEVALLATSALLRLGWAAEGDPALLALHAELDRRAVERPEETVAALIGGGWWHVWFGRRRGDLSPAERRRLALAWMSSPAWSEEGAPEAAREDWTRAVDELLEEGLGGEAMERLCGGGARRWPWIQPFEREQLEELAYLAADLGGLADLAAAVRPDDLSRDPGRPIPGLVLEQGKPELTADLPPGALLWLGAGTPEAALDLAASKTLWERAGRRRDRALAARVRAAVAHLDADPERALDAAAEPRLWGEEGFLDGLAEWMRREDRVEGRHRSRWARLDALLAEAPPRRLRQPPVELARTLAREGYRRAARFLDPEALAGEMREDLVSRALRALCEGRGDDACWTEIATRIAGGNGDGAAEENPLAALAHRIRAGSGLAPEDLAALAESGWETFLAAAGRQHRLLAPDRESALPAFEVGTSLLPGGTLGAIAQRLVFASNSRSFLSKPDWWQGLLSGLRNPRRQAGCRSADDRIETALALLRRSTEDLDALEQGAFFRALELETRETHERTG